MAEWEHISKLPKISGSRALGTPLWLRTDRDLSSMLVQLNTARPPTRRLRQLP